jgi:16S rRNA (adenine1518-N6/adenine1519-N6)-dimethyltransferase
VRLGPILERHGVRAKKRLGQHFLVDGRIIDAIVAAAGIRPGERVLEVGPGAGTLTRALALAGARVHAIEIDRGLEPVLRDVLGGLALEVTWGDALRVPLPEADKVVANLPYRITAPLLARLLERGGWERLVVMVQREVAERALAVPGTKAYGAFTLLVRYHVRPEPVCAVPRGAFLPPPQVDSSVLRLWPEPAPFPRAAFFAVVRAAFAQRRKTLANALGRSPAVELAGLDGRRRAETLTLDEFGRLAVAWHGLLQVRKG